MEGQAAGKSSVVSRLKMSVQKVLFVALLCLLVTVAWSQNLNVTGTTSRKREIVKSFVAEVNALIAKLIRQLQELTTIK